MQNCDCYLLYVTHPRWHCDQFSHLLAFGAELTFIEIFKNKINTNCHLCIPCTIEVQQTMQCAHFCIVIDFVHPKWPLYLFFSHIVRVHFIKMWCVCCMFFYKWKVELFGFAICNSRCFVNGPVNKWLCYTSHAHTHTHIH